MLVCISAEEKFTETSPQNDEGYGEFTQSRIGIGGLASMFYFS